MPKNVVTLLHPDGNGRASAKRLCRKHGLRYAEFEELVEAEVQQTGKLRKRGLSDQFDDILDRMEGDS
jgi:hypothetical protein